MKADVSRAAERSRARALRRRNGVVGTLHAGFAVVRQPATALQLATLDALYGP